MGGTGRWLALVLVLGQLALGSHAGIMQQAVTGNLRSRAAYMPKSELLSWINGLISVEFSEEDFPIRKVLFSAKAEHDSIKNYKLIQQFFIRKGIKTEMDVERLLKGRPMEHLSFLQWLRGFFDQHDRGIRYDALSRRGSRPINGYLGSAGARRAPLRAGQGAGAGRGASTPRWAGEISRGASRAPASPVPDTPGLHSESPRAGRQGAGGGGGTAALFGKERGGSNTLAPQDPPRAGAGAGAGAEGPPASPTTLSALFGEDARLRAERNALQAAVAELVAERDYYYARLRGVEEACQRREDEAAPGGAEAALLEELVGIMYAPDGGGPEARLAPPEPAQAGAAPQTGSEPGACRGDVAAWEEASGRDGGRAASGREAASPSLDSFP